FAGVHPQYGNPNDPACRAIQHHFDDATGVTNSPSTRHNSQRDGIARADDSPRYRLLIGQPHDGDLAVSEDRARDNGMIYLAKRLPGESVVGRDLAIMRPHWGCHLALRFPPDHVSSSPDMRNAGAQCVIHTYHSCLVELDTHLLQAKFLGI